MTVKKHLPSYDPSNPPQGVRLELGVVAAELRVSVRDMATAANVPKTTVCRLLMNEWPSRANAQDRQALRDALEDLLMERGAMPDQMYRLWHAHGPATRLADVWAGRKTNGHNVPGVRAGHPHQPHHPADTDAEDTEMLLPKQALSPAARRHFKLAANPFQGEVVRDEQMFNGDDIRYVRESAWQCCMTGSFVAVVGESGAGKTTVQADLEERIAQASENITVIKPSVLGMEQSERHGTQLRSADILHAIISTLAPLRTMPQTLQARTVAAHKLLEASAALGNFHLLVVEEAHSMPDAALKHLKRLHEMRNGRRPLLGILLIAQPELKSRLANGLRDGSLREVAQRCEIVELLPLDADLRAYLDCRAKAMNAKLDDLIDAQGVEALRERLTVKKDGGKAVSICYPLAVNNLLTRCLNKAAEIGMPTVTRDLVAKV